MREFEEWCAREGARIADEMRGDAIRGISGKSVYFIPAAPGEWARLVLAHDKPEGATDVIRWRISGGAMSTRVDAVPYASLPSQLRDACARMPVYPLPGDASASVGKIQPEPSGQGERDRETAMLAARNDPDTTGEWDSCDWEAGGDGKVYA